MATAALVLAAGESRRFGGLKQLADWGGRPLLEHVVDAVHRWPVDLVVVVLGAHSEEILQRADLGDAPVVVNPEWEEGIASSIRVGLDLLTRDAHVDRTFIALGDQPRIPPSVPPALIEAMEESGRRAIVPRYRYQRANPVLVARSMWTTLMSLEGDTGASGVLMAHPEWVEEVRFDQLPPVDIDTPDDLADLLGDR
jgi:molybdenum cofactor cytidylyltransferase